MILIRYNLCSLLPWNIISLCKLKMLSKHLHLCFFKLKYPSTINLSQPSPPSSTPTNSTMFHFNTTFTNSSNSMDDELPPPPIDFASVFASQRFFFSSPGNSSSIIDCSHIPDYPLNSHTNNNNNNTLMIPKGGVRVPKYSVNPYVDFLRSMHEMIESRQVSLDVTKDWDYLHELLLCYLALNPTHTHKFIVRAFTDLVVDLLSSSSSSSSSSPPPPAMKTIPRRNHKYRRHSTFSARLV